MKNSQTKKCISRIGCSYNDTCSYVMCRQACNAGLTSLDLEMLGFDYYPSAGNLIQNYQPLTREQWEDVRKTEQQILEANNSTSVIKAWEDRLLSIMQKTKELF